MLRKDAEWYLKNLDGISAFEKWIAIVKSDVPTQIANLVKSAANEAINCLTEQGADGGYSFPTSHSETTGISIYWSLTDSYNEENDRGAYVNAWIPRNIDWLTCESEDDPPILGLYYVYSGNRRTARRLNENGQMVSNAIGQLPREYTRVNGIDREWFVCVQRKLTDVINRDRLREPKELESDLVKIFKKFTRDVRPGLECARELLN